MMTYIGRVGKTFFTLIFVCICNSHVFAGEPPSVFSRTVAELKPDAYFNMEANPLGADVVKSDIPALKLLKEPTTVAVGAGPRPGALGHDADFYGFRSDNHAFYFPGQIQESAVLQTMDGVEELDVAQGDYDSFSILLWVMANTNQVEQATMLARPAEDNYQFDLRVEDGHYLFDCRHNDGRSRELKIPVGPTGEWQQLVVVLRSKGRFKNYSGSLDFYVNAERKGQAKTLNRGRTSMLGSREPIFLGARPIKDGDKMKFDRPFNGAIDDLVIWKRALSETEIRELYSAALFKPEPTLIILH